MATLKLLRGRCALKFISSGVLGLVLCGCMYDTTPLPQVKPVSKKSFKFQGEILAVLYQNSKYCYDVARSSKKVSRVCVDERYLKGDIIEVFVSPNKVKTTLIKEHKPHKVPVYRGTKPKPSGIFLPKNETISFD